MFEEGICINGQWKCPRDDNDFRQKDASKPKCGCLPHSPVVCSEKPTMRSTKSYQFLEPDHVSYFICNLGNASILGLLSREEYKALYFKNCSCKATFFIYGGLENTFSVYCYLESNVYSLKMNTPSDLFYDSTAYIQVQRSPKLTKCSVIRISVFASGMVVLFLVLWVWIARYEKGKKKQRRDEIDNDDEDDPSNLQTRLPLWFSFQEL